MQSQSRQAGENFLIAHLGNRFLRMYKNLSHPIVPTTASNINEQQQPPITETTLININKPNLAPEETAPRARSVTDFQNKHTYTPSIGDR